MVGSLFADTIKYTYKGELKVKEDVTFKRADDKYIHYITSSKSFSKIECDKVVEITSATGENIEFSCSISSNILSLEQEKPLKKVDSKPMSMNKVGGGFIFLSGILLMNTTKECEDCDPVNLPNYYISTSEALGNIESHLDKIERKQKLAYMSLIAGGVCLLLDSHYQKEESSNQALNFNLQPTYQGANLTMSYSLD